MIRSTINIKKDSVSRIKLSANILGINLNVFMKRFLQYSVYHNSMNESSFRRIQYQDRAPKRSWAKMHITLDENEYELMLDIRKNYKISISLFVAEAIRMFLDRFIQLLTSKGGFLDNYYNSYSIVKSIDSRGVICWHFYWGLPEFLP